MHILVCTRILLEMVYVGTLILEEGLELRVEPAKAFFVRLYINFSRYKGQKLYELYDY